VTSGISVDIARFEPYHPEEAEARIPLTLDPATGLFVSGDPDARPDAKWFLRVSFLNINFDKDTGRLLPPGEIGPGTQPVLIPSRVPVWDSGWDDGYRTNEFFGEATPVTTPENPLVLRIPLRRIFAIGHRGAPYHFPENTIVSFRKALDLGANGLEFDLCHTKDDQVAVFHDPKPDRARLAFEDFPFPLVSPEVQGRVGLIKKLRDDTYYIAQRKLLFTRKSLHLLRLKLGKVREYYRYRHVGGTEYPIPDLDELLAFASAESDRLHLLFFDIKNPDWDEERDREKYLGYGRVIAGKLRRFVRLPGTIVIANENEVVLKCFMESFRSEGEDRCLFACDILGSLGAWLGFGKNPLEAARRLGTQVVSIGTFLRAGDLEEITEATRDRDYNPDSELTTVLHWTLNEAKQMRASLAAGVNGIVTDRLETLVAVLQSLGVAIQAPSATNRTLA
jgi:glycerophosphoryl diester phosphodiesterase